NNYYTGIGAERPQQFAQIDLNGDGELDIVSVVEDGGLFNTDHEQHVSHNKSPFQTRDRITAINNGLGNKTNMTYKSLTDPAYSNLYDDDNGNHSGWSIESDGTVTFNYKGPQFVVQKASSASPAYNNINNLNSVEYRYGKMRSNSRYGNLGYQWLETIDLQTNVITRTSYKQSYPFIGRPEKTEVWYGSRTSSQLISKATSEYATKVNGSYDKWNEVTNTYQDADIIFPYLSRVVEDSYDFNLGTLNTEELISRVITTSAYDNHGNPITQNAYTCFGYSPNCENSGWLKRIRTVNTYAPANESNWILGRLTRAQVTHYASGQSSITRTSGFEYNSSTGILTAEMIEPDQSGNQQNYIRKAYGHDAYGNLIRTTTCYSGASCSSVPTSDPYTLYRVHRTSATEYDANGRYPVKTRNGYNQITSEVLARNELGQATRIKSITGNITESTFGTFGGGYYVESATGGWTKQVKRFCDGSITCPAIATVRTESSAADGSSQIYQYVDALGRTVKSSKPGFDDVAIITETSYDTKGRVWTTTLPYKSGDSIYKSYYYYDALDRVTRVQHPDIGDGQINEDKTYYDGYISGELAVKTRTINAQNQTKSEFKNAAGELIKVLDNDSNILTYKYNAVGDLLEVKLANVLQSKIQYDSLGRKTYMWDYDKGAQNGNKYWRYTYNGLGELVYQADPKGQQIRIYRDRSGRQIRQLDRNSVGTYVADYRWLYDNSTTVTGKIGKLT
ncbi:MAG: hypothetical protein L3J46_10930, partial [Kangiellaceae bacterium]|nr:hypothetical protein [Kangiellaceae bacterium]